MAKRNSTSKSGRSRKNGPHKGTRSAEFTSAFRISVRLQPRQYYWKAEIVTTSCVCTLLHTTFYQ